MKTFIFFKLLSAGGEWGYICGWGTTSIYGKVQNIVKKAIVPVISLFDCATRFSGMAAFTQRKICASYDSPSVDACLVSSFPFQSSFNQ